MNRCVIVGGADIGDYERIRAYLNDNDYVVYCDSGLRHMQRLGVEPSLIVGDWDSYDDPHLDVETITLPVEKDDTDTVFAVHEGLKRGFKDYLLVGSIGSRLDHSLVNTYILTTLENRGCHGIIVDDYSEMQIISGGEKADGSTQAGVIYVDGSCAFFSLVALEGAVSGVTIRNARFNLEDAEITPDYQYATSNEVLPGRTAEVSVKEGRLLLIKIKRQETRWTSTD